MRKPKEMPYYTFLNEKTNETKEIFFHMDEDKKYIDDSGYAWVRVFNNPNASIDTKVDPNSFREFSDKICNKKNIKMGDLWEESKRLSERREQKMGKDPLREKAIKDYEKKCKGKKPKNQE